MYEDKARDVSITPQRALRKSMTHSFDNIEREELSAGQKHNSKLYIEQHKYISFEEN